MRQLLYVLACVTLSIAILPATGFADEIVQDGASHDEPVAAVSTTDSMQETGNEGSLPQQETILGTSDADSIGTEAGGDSPSIGKNAETTTQPAVPECVEPNTEALVTDEAAIAEEQLAEGDDDPAQQSRNIAFEEQDPEIAEGAIAVGEGISAAKTIAAVNAPSQTFAPIKSVKKPAKKATSAKSYLANGAIYYISSALGKKGAFSVSLKDILGKSKTNVVLAKGVKQLIQYWRVETKGDGIYRFVNCASGYYLAVKGKVKSGSNVYVAKNGAIDWKLKKNAQGVFSLRPAKGGKAYLSIAGGRAKKGVNINLTGSSSNKAQRFKFVLNKRLTKACAKGKTVEPGIVKIRLASSETPLYIATTSKRNNNNAKAEGASSKLSQVFQLRYRGNGLYEFQNANSYKVLTVYKNSKKAGAGVVQYKRALGINQLWYFNKVDGGYQLVSARSGLAIDIEGGSPTTGKNLRMAKPSHAGTQAYTLEKTQLVANGTYIFQSAMALPMVLSVRGNSKENGANVELSRSAGAKGEMFTITHLKDGVYRITNATTKKSVEVAKSSKKSGANIQMADQTGSANQQWIIEVGENGFMFKSAVSGKYLNVNSAQAKRGANVNQRGASAKANQCWTLAPSSWKFYANASSSAMKLIKKAESYEGRRYQWGGRSPSTSFDCAGLVMYCSNKAWGTHFDLMNTNAEMLYDKCTHISAKDAKPGDLVFYRGTYGNDVTYISHVVIYAGNGYMYGAGDPIGYAKVNSVKNIRGNTATAVYARIRH